MTTSKEVSKTVRRSVALPYNLVNQAKTAAPKDLKQNFNRLVIVALEEYVAHRRQESFAQAVAEMARDPDIQRESNAITEEFQSAEEDGL